jgi:hypothetical protein
MKSKLIFIFSLTILAITVSFSFKPSTHDTYSLQEERELPVFYEIENESIFDLKIKQGEVQTLTLEGAEEVMSQIETKVSNGRLIIRHKQGARFKYDAHGVINITLASLIYIENSGTGDLVVTNGFKVKDLSLDNSGTGNANLSLAANSLKIKNVGTGDVKLEGEGTKLNVTNEGTGDINAFKMIFDLVHVSNNGTGDVQVFAEKELTIHSQGTGNVSYIGNAKLNDLVNTGTGEVIKL